ncbi:MAG: polysaccharide deacetylase family protein [Bacteroidales bacterium]|nr:polysaccharide deacetylase family protein [Bacteroidales bacterium]
MIRKERIAARIFKDFIWHFAGHEKELFLTFDDGPNADVTPWVLETLAKYNAKATFFCTGENVMNNQDIYGRAIDEGHSVGNHSFSHLKGWITSNKDYIDDVKKASEFIDSDLFRPPYGKIKPSQSFELKKDYYIIMWDVLTRDYDEDVNPEKCLQYVINHSEGGSIILFHDTLKAIKNLRFVLPRVLEHYSENGFTFKAIDFSKD